MAIIAADYATQGEWEEPQVITALFQKNLICTNAKMTLQDLDCYELFLRLNISCLPFPDSSFITISSESPLLLIVHKLQLTIRFRVPRPCLFIELANPGPV